ncbi:hypothetical protein X797_002905 [Metarhizium robertsii]|uniref:FAD-binding PCMH-type domain-containing protein n=1 Tax=Metarhizium robertsii TaxID=568076 RepID=A0A0A1V4N1_9HYPO|nr:hypothetical protein X797_002905 [Metarhizium robertsii]
MGCEASDEPISGEEIISAGTRVPIAATLLPSFVDTRRSSGAPSLSIWAWARHLKHIELVSNWRIPGANKISAVLAAGSGLSYDEAVLAALDGGRVTVSGNNAAVGLGRHISGGGHGPLSSTYGLATDIYQARVVKTKGHILTDETQNQDPLWAIQCRAAGQCGIVSEYVLKTYAAPTTLVNPILSLSLADNTVDLGCVLSDLEGIRRSATASS